MTDLTVSIEDGFLQRAREAAIREKASVNALVRDFLWVNRLNKREPVKGDRIRGWLVDLAENYDIVISTQGC